TVATPVGQPDEAVPSAAPFGAAGYAAMHRRAVAYTANAGGTLLAWKEESPVAQFNEVFRQQLTVLADKVRTMENLGMSNEGITGVVTEVGDWLAREAEPRCPEQRLLKEMWQNADNQEQSRIASALIKLADQTVGRNVAK